MAKSLMMLVNPAAGRSMSDLNLGTAVSTFALNGYCPTVFYTTAPGTASKIVEENAANYERLVCLGGDGTLSGILDIAERLGVRSVITVGALLADVPHSRPIPVTVTTDDQDLQRELGLDQNTYEGPTGIVGVLQHEALRRGLRGVSVWGAVPHYVAHPPSPKAAMALLVRIEELLGEPVPLGELPQDAEAWQHGVDELAADDPEIAEYVAQLEEAKDTADLPEASGEAIAREFEKYLRRRDGSAG